MEKQIPLTKMQKEIMQEFYSVDATRVVMNKNERNALWKKVVKREDIANLDEIQKVCPAIFHQIKRSYEGINNVQSAVFSECAYAQTLANMTGLKEFINCYDDPNFVPEQVANLLKSYFLTPRYIYANEDASRMLIQAGGCNGIDSALITVIDLNTDLN